MCNFHRSPPGCFPYTAFRRTQQNRFAPSHPPSSFPLVPKVRADIGLKLLLCRGAREGVSVPVTQHEAGNLERIGKRGGHDGGWSAQKRKREFWVKTHHSG